MPATRLASSATGLLEAIRECASLVDRVGPDDDPAVDGLLDQLDDLTQTVIRRELPSRIERGES
jgi:hypothetical protein